MQPDDSWAEWMRHVLSELQRLNTNLTSLDDKLSAIKDDHITPLKVEIAMLQVKSGMWDMIGGAIPVILMVLIEVLKK